MRKNETLLYLNLTFLKYVFFNFVVVSAEAAERRHFINLEGIVKRVDQSIARCCKQS